MTSKIDELIKNYDGSNIKSTFKMKFVGVEGYDVFNPCSTFLSDVRMLIATRVEKRGSEYSKILFFEQSDMETWTLFNDLNSIPLQDPFHSIVNKCLLFGGTQFIPNNTNPKSPNYRIELMYGKDISSLLRICFGPDGMRNIRVCEGKNCVIVFTHYTDGDGSIGYFIVDDVKDINLDTFNTAKRIKLFDEKYDCAVSHAILLRNGKIGCFGYLNKIDENGNIYSYCIAFEFDPELSTTSDVQIIIERKYLTNGQNIKVGFENLLTPGGLIRNSEGTADVFVGVSNSESHFLRITDPFLLYDGEVKIY